MVRGLHGGVDDEAPTHPDAQRDGFAEHEQEATVPVRLVTRDRGVFQEHTVHHAREQGEKAVRATIPRMAQTPQRQQVDAELEEHETQGRHREPRLRYGFDGSVLHVPHSGFRQELWGKVL